MSYTITDHAGNVYHYANIEAAMTKFIACEGKNEHPHLTAYGEPVSFAASPRTLKRSGYSYKEIMEQFREQA